MANTPQRAEGGGSEDEVRPGSPVLGREPVLARLRAAVDGAVAGRGSVVLITGDPGIGKTSVATAAVTYAQSRDAKVLWGPAWEGEGTPGYWPWVQVMRAYLHGAPPERVASLAEGELREIGRLIPELVPLAPAPTTQSSSERDRFQLFDAVARTLTDAASSQPLVLILDDLQWADPPSVGLLGFLSRRIYSSSMLVIGTYRDIDIGHDHPLASLLADLSSRSTVIPLTGLGADDVARLLSEVAGEEPREELAALVQRRTGGNPFFVQETARVLMARDAGLQVSTASGIPEGVRETIERRLARLSQPCTRLLEIAAVAGGAATLPMLRRITSDAVPELVGLLSQAVGARILEEPASAFGMYRFAHDLFRETIYDSLDGPTRAALHLRVAGALEDARAEGSDVHLSELAHHFVLAAGMSAEEKALLYSTQAAEEARGRFSYDEAASLYGRAVEMVDLGAPTEKPTRLRLLLDRAEALRLAGRAKEARATLAAATDAARRDGDAATLARATLEIHALGLETGHFAERHFELLQEALRALADDEAGLRARILASVAQHLIWSERDPDGLRARRAVEEGCRLARGTGSPGTLAFCLLARHDVLWRPGTEKERLALADEIIALAQDAGDRPLLMEARLLRCAALLALGDIDTVVELERFLRDGLESPHVRVRYLALSRSAAHALLGGRFEEAETLIFDAYSLARDIGEPDGWQVMFAQLLELRSGQGRRFDLLDDEHKVKQAESGGGSIGRAFLAVARLEQGELHLHAPIEYDVAPSSSSLAILALNARLAAASNRPDACRRLYDALLPFAETNVVNAGAVTFLGAVSYYLGLLAGALGRTTDAVSHLEAALEMHERLGAHPWSARTRYELGRVLSPDPATSERARSLLAGARATAERLGMGALARATAEPSEKAKHESPPNVFRREGHIWTLGYEGEVVRMRDAKGLRDIAALLGERGKEVRAADLVSVGIPEARGTQLGADDVIDPRARREYRARLTDLEDDIADAEADNDPERAARAKEERDAIAHELAAALGLSGRARRLGDESEKARKAVTARIRDSIARIHRVHPRLGDHLNASITTGSFCSYSPPNEIEWRL